jgi:hypothetical protein
MTAVDLVAELRAAFATSGLSQGELGGLVARAEGRGVPYRQNTVSQWLAGSVELAPGLVFALERALQLRPGVLSVHAGYLPADAVTSSLELALAADRDLTPSQREDVLAVVEVMRARTRARRG